MGGKARLFEMRVSAEIPPPPPPPHPLPPAHPMASFWACIVVLALLAHPALSGCPCASNGNEELCASVDSVCGRYVATR